ncbi:SRPBCC family protein [Fimbriimonas ginsengisoli]|uniref:Activator of Hsp90 ATPase 1 family protein n=1 Tax=Fimbriimonas ginsengisoli Gsoil 348 TaxID=661478 RepID=A0A068NYQ3_FIMGI|nr:SRPBCC domain-containing protein [Fimbriimonas ginsengisoli]AIE87224.1 Activator of Hsp90 ATPase 1 family protein [Fimbriimonas ginsengisoli Gsoil 348]
MKQIPSAPEIAIVSGDFEQFSPQELYDYFTQVDLLTQWWPKEAEIDLKVGGQYRMSWPENDWHLRGEYTALEPGVHLGFTWAWDHEPSNSLRKQVDIWFQPLFENGGRLAAHHGPFDTSENDQSSRQGIVEGWIHFGMRLAGLKDGNSE